MILNSEQLPHINRTFAGGASWLDYETTSPRAAADIATISPRSHKTKDRSISAKSMTPLSTNIFVDSSEPHPYPPSSVCHHSNLIEDHHHHHRSDRFPVSNDGMNIRGGSNNLFGNPHSASGNVFLSQHSHYDYPDEFSPNVGAAPSMNNPLSSSPIWYQSLSSREGLGSGEELSPYDLSPRQHNTHWSSFSQNQCTDHPLSSIGLYQNVEGINDDSTLELAQRVLQYPISNETSQNQCLSAIRGHENGVGGGNTNHEEYLQELRQPHHNRQSNNLQPVSHQSHSWKEVENQLTTNNKCISIPGGGTLQALHPMQPGQRSLSRTSIYSNNSSTSDRGSPSMAMLSNIDPTNPTIPVQVNIGGGVAGSFPQGTVSVVGENHENSSLEPIHNSDVQRSLETLQSGSHHFGSNVVRGRLVNPTLTHNMDELEIVSSVSSESTPLSTEQNISSNLSETHVSNVYDGVKHSLNVNRKPSTD